MIQMDPIVPRGYQQEAFDAVIAQVSQALVKLPTGSGKTILFPMMAKHKRFRKKKTLILAEHENLLEQAREKILLMYPNADIGIVGFGKSEWDHDIILGGVDTLAYAHRLKKLSTMNIGLIIADECHHASSKSYLDIFASCPDAFKFGVTATVDRADGKDITDIFGPAVYNKTINEMIDEGWLCSLTPYIIRTKNTINVSVSKKTGDFSESKLEQAVNRKDRNEQIVQACCEEKYGGPDIRTVVFCAGTDHAKAQADAFNRAGIPAAAVTQDVLGKEREQIFKDFANGKIKVLTNIEILTEGWDADVRRIVLARPTKSRPLLTQMVGRGTRTAPGKEECIILDLTDNWLNHSLEPCSLEDVFGLPVVSGETIKQTITKAKEESGGAIPEDGEEKRKREREGIDERNSLVEKKLTFKYDWQQIEGGAYIASVGTKVNGGDLILYPSKKGGYLVGVSYKESPLDKQAKEVIVARNVPLSWAQSIAEQQGKNLQAGNQQFVDPDAPWRKQAPTDKQMTALNKLRRITHGKLIIPKDISRGEAAQLLTRGYAMLRK